MGIADEIENGTFEGMDVTEEQLTDLRVEIAKAGLPVIEFLIDHFAKDCDKPTIREMARMAVTAIEVSEFLENRLKEEVERTILLAAIAEIDTDH